MYKLRRSDRRSLHSGVSYKRLEKGRFVWPPIVDGTMILTPAQFSVLIDYAC